MSLNLTEEGICEDAYDIVNLETSKVPFGVYKKDNSDLRSDDRPWLTIATKHGKFYHYQL